jgi:hypothetical protein
VEIQGYVFLPAGSYTNIEVPVTDSRTAGLETIVQAWDSETQLVGVVAAPASGKNTNLDATK